MHRLLVAAFVVVPFAAPARAQESAARFDAPLVTLGPLDRFAFLTDLDHDGFQDAVSWWFTSPDMDVVRVSGLRNDGTGKLVSLWSTNVDVNPDPDSFGYVRILPCQIDADGNTDICIAYSSFYVASIRVLKSRGLLAPDLAVDYSITHTNQVSAPVVHALVADFSGDGRADLAYTVDGTLRMMEFVPGQPGLTQRSLTYPFGGDPHAEVGGLLEIDANGDATPDLLTWRGTVVRLVEVQACQPGTVQSFFPGIVDYKPASGDLDGDGDRDLVLWGPSTFVVARRTGPAAWSLEPPVTGGPSEFLVDVDADGDLDGVCCSGGGPPVMSENTQPSTFRVSVNDGTGRFAPALETPWLGSDHLAGITDLDHDGDLDVVAGRCILYARRPLTERLQPLLASSQTESTTADIDGDSDPDFTIGMRTMERNLGDGQLTAHSASFPAPPPGTTFVGPGWPGDFDGDGDVDLLVKHSAGSTLLSERLLANLGGGAFVDAGAAGPAGASFNPGIAGNHPQASLAADVDGDGDVDLITRAYVASNYRSLVWLNDGAGHFTAGPGVLDQHVSWVGDLSGDGIPDLAGGWLEFQGSSAYGGWTPGLGGGAFGARVTLTPFPYPAVRFAVADLDADDDLDLAISDLSRLSVYWNDGSGLFTPELVPFVSLFSSTSSHQVWSTDVDGDGRLDLLATGCEKEPGGLLVLLRRADNSGWKPPLVQMVHPDAHTLDGVLRDVDGDGDEDLVTNRLVRNRRHSLTEDGRRKQTGTGTSGTGGLVPTLGADGPFRVGESAELRIRGGVGGATGVLTVTRIHGGHPGSGGQSGPRAWIAPTFDQVLARIPFTLSGTPGQAGTGCWNLPFTIAPDLASEIRRYRVEIDDPAAAGGFARTNEMVLSFGP